MMSALCSMLTSWSTQSIWPSAAIHGKSKTRHIKSFKAETKEFDNFKMCVSPHTNFSPAKGIHTHTRTHTHLQRGEPSTCACALWLCRTPDVSAAFPHTGRIPSALPGRGQFFPPRPSRPDSPTSPIAAAELHSGRNKPGTAVESRQHFRLCRTEYLQFTACSLTARCKGLTGILLSASSRQLNEISKSCKGQRRKIVEMKLSNK